MITTSYVLLIFTFRNLTLTLRLHLQRGNSDVIKTNFESLSMQLFSLNFHYFVDVTFVLVSCLFSEQNLFENFVSILKQLSNAYVIASFDVLAT